jgi:hypothetical protein
MISEEDFMQKVELLVEQTQKDAIIMARRLYRSGALDLDNPDYVDSYILPKLYMMAYASRMRDIWSPWGNRKMNPKLNREVKNMEKFL